MREEDGVCAKKILVDDVNYKCVGNDELVKVHIKQFTFNAGMSIVVLLSELILVCVSGGKSFVESLVDVEVLPLLR